MVIHFKLCFDKRERYANESSILESYKLLLIMNKHNTNTMIYE